jgi:hypothetical protein
MRATTSGPSGWRLTELAQIRVNSAPGVSPRTHRHEARAATGLAIMVRDDEAGLLLLALGYAASWLPVAVNNSADPATTAGRDTDLLYRRMSGRPRSVSRQNADKTPSSPFLTP